MKKIAVGIAVVLGFTLLQPASAQASSPSIVIIDHAIDSTRPEFAGKLIHEVCLPSTGACPNGQPTQEGPGAATLPSNIIYANRDSHHGTFMTSVALQVNPNARIIFIRIGSVFRNSLRDEFSPLAIARALDWSLQNRNRFNIVAVSGSFANKKLYTESSCPVNNSTANRALTASTLSLVSNGIAVFYAAGNQKDKTKVSFPACVSQSIAVSAVNRFSQDDGWKVSPETNAGLETDFYALGSFDTPFASTGILGFTSPATAALASFFLKNYKGSYDATINHLKSISSPSPKNFINVLG